MVIIGDVSVMPTRGMCLHTEEGFGYYERIVDVIHKNGAKACELYDKYTLADTGRPIHKLPSTSPANAAWSFARLTDEWKKSLLPFLEK